MIDRLVEVRETRQIKGEPFRRWFRSDYFDLYVWLGSSGDIVGFQLAYNKEVSERILTWRVEKGFLHESVDAGETPGKTKMSPVLVPDGAFPSQTVTERFLEECGNIETGISEFVYEKIKNLREKAG